MQSTIQQPTAKTWNVFRPTTWPIFASKEQAEITGEGASIQIFESVGAIDKKILWLFEMVSSLAVLLLAFGLITSQTNVQTHGLVLTDNPGLQQAWAWTQNIAIDMSLLGAIIRACVYWLEKERMKALLYTLLSGLLLFTAAIVSNIEAVQQSVEHLSLPDAYGKVLLPISVEHLTAIRSLAIVLILVAHAVQYVSWYHAKYRAKKLAGSTPVQTVATPVDTSAASVAPVQASDFLEAIREMREMNNQNLQAMQELHMRSTQVTVSLIEETVSRLSATLSISGGTQVKQLPEGGTPGLDTDELEVMALHTAQGQTVGSFERPSYKEDIESLLQKEPALSDREIAERVTCSLKTAKRWRERFQQAVQA